MSRAKYLEKTLMLERLNTGEEGDNRGQDGWTASLTQWTWVWANSGRWWRTGMPGVLQSTGSQRVGHDWATEWQNPGFCWLPRRLSGKESTCQYRRRRFDPWIREIPGGGNSNLLHYSCLENPMDRGDWWAIAHGVTESQTQLNTHTHILIFPLL